MKKFAMAFAAAALVAASATPSFAEGDPVAGERVFKRCQACHVVQGEPKPTGPTLEGVIGRTAGTVEGFRYSDAMVESGIVWDETTIAEYLAAPKTYIPGNRMAFAGLRNEQQIADVIAYIKANGG